MLVYGKCASFVMQLLWDKVESENLKCNNSGYTLTGLIWWP